MGLLVTAGVIKSHDGLLANDDADRFILVLLVRRPCEPFGERGREV